MLPTTILPSGYCSRSCSRPSSDTGLHSAASCSHLTIIPHPCDALVQGWVSVCGPGMDWGGGEGGGISWGLSRSHVDSSLFTSRPSSDMGLHSAASCSPLVIIPHLCDRCRALCVCVCVCGGWGGGGGWEDVCSWGLSRSHVDSSLFDSRPPSDMELHSAAFRSPLVIIPHPCDALVQSSV